jgi:formylmethanofuran dehydrogenase subunit E
MSCFVDGVQLGSGCTLGKGNIDLSGEELVEARFSSEDGRHLRMRARAETLERLRPRLEGEDLDRVSREFLEMPPEALFEISSD